ncbi:hypothetical protein KSC_033340 [Ktedonobacter sp. SOSP1-52]|nr:hypothetical protein KSC_033340 [Ktedonobacter sp. SOSP1-52]
MCWWRALEWALEVGRGGCWNASEEMSGVIYHSAHLFTGVDWLKACLLCVYM